MEEAPEYTWTKSDPYIDSKPPLFAHECLGAYDVTADDRFDHTEYDETEAAPQPSRRSSRDVGAYTVDEVDINDPTIEKFPTDRSDVMDSLRKIQSSLSEDIPEFDDTLSSSHLATPRTSVDSIDDGPLSTGSLSPTSTSPLKRRDNRVSQSSFVRLQSAVSLTSIAEEPKAGNEADPRTPASALLGGDNMYGGSHSRISLSEEDEGMVMKHRKSRVKMTNKTADEQPEVYNGCP